MQHKPTSKRQIEYEYKQLLDQYLHCGSKAIFLYWKGRVALYAILKAMGVGVGDEVIIQGYTCVVVANAVIYLGATPVYADIDRKTYNYDMQSLESKITEKTKVIICQNTYGLSSNLEKIQKIASEYGIYTIEDCTHGFGGKYHGIPNGTSCDASFFSTQWNKPFSTGVGGFAVIHNAALLEEMRRLGKEEKQPDLKEQIELKLMYFVRGYLVNDLTYWPMVSLYRVLSRHNIVVGSSSGEEVRGIDMPIGYFKAMSVTQMKKGISSLKKLDDVNKLRRKNAVIYTRFLMKYGKNHIDRKLFPDHMFLKYPLLVDDREEFRKRAEKEKIILGEWFEAPIYPYTGSMTLWGVNTEEIPVAMEICQHIVNLPTDTRNVKKVLRFLKKEMNLIQSDEGKIEDGKDE